MSFSQMIAQSTFGCGLALGSAEFIRIALFAFVALLSTIDISLTSLFCRLIVVSFWECKPRVTLFQIWFARRRRKPPDKISVSFPTAAFRKLIVTLVCFFEVRVPGESPVDPSIATRLGAIRKRKQFCEYLKGKFELFNSQRYLPAMKERYMRPALKVLKKRDITGEHDMHLLAARSSRSAIAQSKLHGGPELAHLITSLRAHCRLSSLARKYTVTAITLFEGGGANEGISSSQ